MGRKKITPEQQEEAALAAREWLRKNDLRLFEAGLKIPDAYALFKKETQCQITSRGFLQARGVCKYWKTARLHREHHDGSLTEMEWVAVIRVVKARIEELRGVSIKLACKLVRTELCCRESMLRELPRELRVWKDA